jgi:hypothetical protein
VIVADDGDVFLRAAASVISATSTLRLVGAAGSGHSAPALSSCSAASSGLAEFDRVRGGSDPGRVTNLVRVPPHEVNISADRLC